MAGRRHPSFITYSRIPILIDDQLLMMHTGSAEPFLVNTPPPSPPHQGGASAGADVAMLAPFAATNESNEPTGKTNPGCNGSPCLDSVSMSRAASALKHAERLDRASLRADWCAAQRMRKLASRERQRSYEMLKLQACDGFDTNSTALSGPCGLIRGPRSLIRQACRAVPETDEDADAELLLLCDSPTLAVTGCGPQKPPGVPPPMLCFVEILHVLLGCNASLR